MALHTVDEDHKSDRTGRSRHVSGDNAYGGSLAVSLVGFLLTKAGGQ